MADTTHQSKRDSVGGPAAWEHVVWFGMRVEVPSEWAMVRHSTNAKKGRLVWMDRRRQRMQLSWLDCPSKPDMEQVLKDYRSMDLSVDAETKFEPVRGLLGWQMLRSRGERCLTRGARYEPGIRRWVEVVLEWPDRWDAQMEREVFSSFEVEDRNDVPRHWRALGMDMQVAEGWELLRVDAHPADVRWLFSKPGRELIVQRRGMLETWFDGDLQRMIMRQMPEQKAAFSEAMVNGHAAIVGTSRETTTRIMRWMGKQRVRRDWAWPCEADKAVWQVTVTGGEDDEHVALHEVAVDCCGNAGGA